VASTAQPVFPKKINQGTLHVDHFLKGIFSENWRKKIGDFFSA